MPTRLSLTALPSAQDCLQEAYERMLPAFSGRAGSQRRSATVDVREKPFVRFRLSATRCTRYSERASTLPLRGEVHALEEGLEAGV